MNAAQKIAASKTCESCERRRKYDDCANAACCVHEEETTPHRLPTLAAVFSDDAETARASENRALAMSDAMRREVDATEEAADAAEALVEANTRLADALKALGKARAATSKAMSEVCK